MHNQLNQLKVVLMGVSLVVAGAYYLSADKNQEMLGSQYALLFIGFCVLTVAIHHAIDAVKAVIMDE